MRIAVISDTHDNIWKLEELLKGLKDVDLLIHCGDICSPFMVRKIKEYVKSIPVYIVWGNNDGDKLALIEAGADAPNIIFEDDFARIELDGLLVVVTHYREIAVKLSENETYDLILFGHTHEAEEKLMHKSLLVNPGEVMGLMGRSTYAIIETKPLEVEFIEI
jgi:putative phosphoesterase